MARWSDANSDRNTEIGHDSSLVFQVPTHVSILQIHHYNFGERLDDYITIRVFTYYLFNINIVMKSVLFTLLKNVYYLAWIV